MTNTKEMLFLFTFVVLMSSITQGASIFDRILRVKTRVCNIFGTKYFLSKKTVSENVINFEGCSLSIAADYPDKDPVLLINTTNGFALLKPKNDAVHLRAKQEVIISCPGARNIITAIGADFASAKCIDGQNLNVTGKRYLLSDLGCDATVTGEVDISTTKCGGTRHGVIKSIGHKVNGQFLTLFTVCYDDKKGESLYADHVLYGSSVDYSKPSSGRPSFKVGGVAANISADYAYKQTTQIVTFADTLGSNELAAKYIKTNSFLARGHLSPAGDFIYGSSQFSSYFYINTVPQWQSINNGNWKSLEFAVRSVASAAKSHFRVITGGYQILSLQDLNGNDAEIYLANRKQLPIPKFVWKIVYSVKTKEAIAFVSLNNPFVEKVTDDDYLCKDICEANGWWTAAWQNPAKGLVYCCSVSDLKEVIKTIPTFKVTGILQRIHTKSLAKKVLEIFGL